MRYTLAHVIVQAVTDPCFSAHLRLCLSKIAGVQRTLNIESQIQLLSDVLHLVEKPNVLTLLASQQDGSVSSMPSDADILAMLGDTSQAVPELGTISSDLCSQSTLNAHLSKRESQVYTLLQRGQSNEQIAQELSIALGTVKNHIVKLYDKLGVNTRSEAVARAWMSSSED